MGPAFEEGADVLESVRDMGEAAGTPTPQSSLSTRRVRKRLGTQDLGSSLDTGLGRGRGRGGGGGGSGRPSLALSLDGKPSGSRWCKPLYRADPAVMGALLRADTLTGLAKDKKKIVCRLCSGAISFAASSYTTAEKHVATHGVTRGNVDIALALAQKADEGGQAIPMQAWKDRRLAAGEGDRKVRQYMEQAPYATGGQLWREIRTAAARWIATDSMPLSVVESVAFRRFCTALDGRCPPLSRKSITKRVRILPLCAAIVCCHCLLPLLVAKVCCQHSRPLFSFAACAYWCCVFGVVRVADHRVVRRIGGQDPRRRGLGACTPSVYLRPMEVANQTGVLHAHYALDTDSASARWHCELPMAPP